MADTYTSGLRLAQQTIGGNENTWGTILNATVAMLDEAIAGVAVVSVTTGNVTLSTANNATDESRPGILFVTGTPGVTRTVTFANVKKTTWVVNQSDSAITIGAGGGATVSVPAGAKAAIRTDGATNASSLVLISSFAATLLDDAAASNARTTLGLAQPGVVTLTDGATVALDASLGSVFDLTAVGNRTLSNPTNATSGQRIVIRHKASGADRTLTLGTAFRFGTDLAALTATTNAKTDYIGCVYHGTDSKWDVVGYMKGF